jgi:hypothetical protein
MLLNVVNSVLICVLMENAVNRFHPAAYLNERVHMYFIWGLFNGTFSILGCIASNVGIINELLIRKNIEAVV